MRRKREEKNAIGPVASNGALVALLASGAFGCGSPDSSSGTVGSSSGGSSSGGPSSGASSSGSPSGSSSGAAGSGSGGSSSGSSSGATVTDAGEDAGRVADSAADDAAIREDGGNADAATLWNLDGWELQLPSGTPDNPDLVENPTGFGDDYFFVAADGSLTFMDPPTGVTTSGSSHPRSELTSWPATGANAMTATVAVTKVPSSVTIGQIFQAPPAPSKPLLELEYETGGRRLRSNRGERSRLDGDRDDREVLRALRLASMIARVDRQTATNESLR